MHHLYKLLVLLACSATLVAAEAPYHPRTVVVRLEGSSTIAHEWISAQRTGSIAAFEALLGRHHTEGYVSNATLTAVRKAEWERKDNALLQDVISPLPYIARIEYERDIDPLTAARKLASHPDVVYAEPLYVQELVAAPNDPLSTSQYYLSLVKAPEAWDELPKGTAPTLVGIVDTGIDTLHPDLNANVWRNPGETGRDQFGNDLRFNGVDDDENGFVDDWIGWDFVGATDQAPDNMPLPGHPHGTHVGGIVAAIVNNGLGIAGVAQNVKVVPIKIALDNPNSRSVSRAADGILYAAAIGCDVINCSFGSASQSFADADVVDAATRLGSLIVGAAGNDGMDQAFYPAAHPPVLSVAATDTDDTRAFFSNMHATVDVSAPGYTILSTVTNGDYDYYDGTSMAAPIAAAIAAMVKQIDRSLTPAEVRAIVKASSDNIDAVNISFIGRIGMGRVNALNSVRQRNRKYAELVNFTITDANGNGIYEAGEELSISLDVTNILAPLNNGRVVVTPAPSDFQPFINVNASDLGQMRTGEEKTGTNDLSIRLPIDAPLNAQMSLLATIYEGDTVIGRDLITSTVNPSYRTLRDNDLTLSVNSTGHIGYNDYPTNEQGVGFQYRDGGSMLYEGAFLIGISPTYLPNGVRSATSGMADRSFRLRNLVEVRTDSVPSGVRAVAGFDDRNDAFGLGLTYRHNVYQPTADSLRSSVIITFDVSNPADTSVNGIYAGMFFDWDTSPFGADDGVAWDHERGILIHQNARRTDVPTVAMSLLSPMNINVYAIDNGGDFGSPGIYDGFTRAEKWLMMSGGISRRNSRVTDVSALIAGGPFDLLPGESRQVAFAISLGNDLFDASDKANAARNAAIEMGLDAAPYSPTPLADGALRLRGGQVQQPGPVQLEFLLQNPSPVTIDLVDLQGGLLGVVYEELDLLAGRHEVTVDLPNVATGVYILRMVSRGGSSSLVLQIVP